ncbi:MAG: ATP-binding protein [Butyrivibrio sp.]|nr:ATP-binding protein [Butyrivibrio sp.]
MKLKRVTIKNFRGYREKIQIDFDDLTAFVGKNDIGKSSILEALDIFFNNGNGTVKLDKDDINKQAVLEEDKDIIITACFDELPSKIVIDATNETNLAAEYLLNESDQLEIKKRYSNGGTAKVYIRAIHPTNSICDNLLLKTNKDLQKMIDNDNIDCTDKTRNAVMRQAIWKHYETDLQLEKVEIDVTKGETKSIWDKLQTYLPVYSLFQSDRKNTDGDSEVQDPLKEAVKQILNDDKLSAELADVAQEVEFKLREVAERTLAKLREMSPETANSLYPVIPSANSLKWADVFKSVSISGDEGIPINKRGSGVKRLILLNFFRAEAERRIENIENASIIYAIEEPETSQHTENQRRLIDAFLQLASAPNTQVIITTHSSNIVKKLDFSNLRLIINSGEGKKVDAVLPGQLPYPSLNEVNYLAFAEITEEYHNELYGYIEAEGLLNSYKNGRATVNYIKIKKNGNTSHENITMTEYIRHQIHHPENNLNPHFLESDLSDSIQAMREFIQNIGE